MFSIGPNFYISKSGSFWMLGILVSWTISGGNRFFALKNKIWENTVILNIFHYGDLNKRE
jgi:hypothetical protein